MLVETAATHIHWYQVPGAVEYFYYVVRAVAWILKIKVLSGPRIRYSSRAQGTVEAGSWCGPLLCVSYRFPPLFNCQGPY